MEVEWSGPSNKTYFGTNSVGRETGSLYGSDSSTITGPGPRASTGKLSQHTFL